MQCRTYVRPDILYNKERFAYLAIENLRNFLRTQEITKRFSRYMAWAAVSYLAYTVFSGPSIGDVAIQSTFFIHNQTLSYYRDIREADDGSSASLYVMA